MQPIKIKLHATPQNTTHVDRRACGRANSRPHAHTTRRNMERECPNPVTKPKLKTWVPGSKHYTPTWNKACRRESARLEHTRNRTLTQWDGTWSASVQTQSRNRNSRHECRDLNATLQHETRHADEREHGSSTLETARSHENRTLWECQGSVTKPMNDTRPKWQNPDTNKLATATSTLYIHYRNFQEVIRIVFHNQAWKSQIPWYFRCTYWGISRNIWWNCT